MSVKVFKIGPDKTIPELAHAVRKMLSETEKLDAQVFCLEDGEHVVQACCKCSRMARLCGMDRAISVNLSAASDELIVVNVSRGKWNDKLPLFIGAMIIWPLIVPAVIAAYRQGRLSGRIMRTVEGILKEE